MTREEAIKIINCYDIGFYDLNGEKIPAYKLADAFDMAIEALQEPKTVITMEPPYKNDKGLATVFENKDNKLILEEVKEITVVVRCQDCKQFRKKGEGYGCCLEGYGNVDGNHYCSYGERKDE